MAIPIIKEPSTALLASWLAPVPVSNTKIIWSRLGKNFWPRPRSENGSKEKTTEEIEERNMTEYKTQKSEYKESEAYST